MVLRIIAGTAAVISIFALSGCMGVSNSNFSAWCPPGAPCSVSYSTATPNYTVNDAMSIGASVSGGTPSTYSISPSLPTGLGLSFDTTTGTISGTPTETTSPTTYTITATNDSGSASTTVTFAIVAQAVLTISPSTATMTVGGSLTFTASNGTSPYTFTKTGGSGSTSGNSFTLTAPTTPTSITVTVTDSSTPTPQTASATVAVVAGSATQLVWVTPPSTSATAGTTLSSQPKLQAEDAYGNVVTSFSSMVTIGLYTAEGCGTTTDASVSGNSVTASSGVTSFTSYTINADGSYFVEASGGGVTSTCYSTGIAVSGSTGTAIQLTWATQPSSTGSPGTALATQPKLRAEDIYGNTVTSFSGTVTMSLYTGPGCGSSASPNVSGNSASPSLGVASFSSYEINNDGTYYYEASGGGLTTACSSSGIGIAGSTGTATQIIYNTLPSNAVNSGQALFVQPVLQVEDTHGNVVTSASNPITLAAYTDSACTTAASGTVSATTNPLDATSGIATFTGAIYTGTAGTIYLGATDTADGLTLACSGAITVSAGSASKLAFTTEPSPSASTGVSLVVSPQVSIEDASSNVVTSAGNSITLAAYTNSSCTTAASGTLSANFNPLSATSGIASFTGVTYTGSAGTIYLGASATGLASGCSAAITVTAGSCDGSLGTVTNGSMPLTDPSAGILPLCNGDVLVGDYGQNTITNYAALSGETVVETYNVSKPPAELMLDSANNLLYAGDYNPGYSSSTTLTQLNLGTTVETDIPVGGAVGSLALATNGYVFAGIDTNWELFGGVVYVNGPSATLDSTLMTNTYETMVAFDPLTNSLFTTTPGSEPPMINNYSFTAPSTLTSQGSVDNTGGNFAVKMILSPDGTHLAVVTDMGNDYTTTPYEIYDYSPSNLSAAPGNGYWTAGSSYLTSAAFSPDGNYFAVSDANNVYIYNVSTHAHLTTFSPSLCSLGSISQVAFSQGSKVLFAYADCSSGGMLYWTAP